MNHHCSGKFAKLFLSLLLAGISIGAWAQAPVKATILHTNNLHGHLESDKDGKGGMANVAGYIDEVRNEVGLEKVILIDAGSSMQGDPISNLFQGKSVIDVFNLLNYDAMTLGNHDFDWGSSVLQERAQQAIFPFLAANIVIAGTDQPPKWLRPYVIVKVDGVRIGIIGLVTRETPNITAKGVLSGLELKDEFESLLRYYDEVRSISDSIVIVFHCGWETTPGFLGVKDLAKKMLDAGRPLDLIIGARQINMNKPDFSNNTAHVVAWKYGYAVGRADVKNQHHNRILR